jgi:hypothetical protein
MDISRYEYKYLINTITAQNILSDLNMMAYIDPYVTHSVKGYQISSLYFDGMGLPSFYEKINGELHRKKLRIRVYLDDIGCRNYILEIKERVKNVVRKRRCNIEEDEYFRLIQKFSMTNKTLENQVCQEFYYHLKRNSMFPKIVIDYNRLAYIGRNNRYLRVTLDSNLKAYLCSDFDLKKTPIINIIPHNMTILEIKTLKELPYWVKMIVQKYNLQNQAISKYCLSLQKYYPSLSYC